jgi:hypothetical protein
MTVIVTARLGRRKSLNGRLDLPLERLDVVAYMRQRGCLHHHLLELDDEWWLYEEWESAEVFEDFFDRTVEFRRALREAGFREFPDELSLWRPIQDAIGDTDN